MNRFRSDNTEGYDSDELAVLNERYAAETADLDDPDDYNECDAIAERVLADYDEARDTSALLRTAIDATGSSARGFALVLAVDERTVRRWLAGERPMPGPAAQLCRLLAAHPDLVAVIR